jgi:ABC-type phosphate/phosphonate transport system permease subunit
MTSEMNMKTEMPKILYANMLASLFTWFLLAGLIVLPMTFASIRNSHAPDSIAKAGKVLFGVVQKIPLLVIAGICCLCGVIGLSWLCWENRNNYVDRVFL